MKKFSLLVLILFVVCIKSYSATDYTLDAACTGAWLMNVDEDPITDSSAAGNDGTLRGAGEPDFIASAKFGGGYQFDANNDFADVGTLGIFANLSGGAWVTIAGAFSRWTRIMDRGTNLYFAADNTTAIGLRHSYIGGGYTTVSHTWLTDGTWQHVFFTYDGSEIKIYANGVDKGGALGLSGSFDISGGALSLGRGANNSWDDKIDEACLFSRALDSTEINELMDNGLEGDQGVTPAAPSGVVPLILILE